MTLDQEVINLYFAEVTTEDDAAVEMTVTRIAHETGLAVPKIRRIIFGEDETGTDPKCPYYLKKYHGDVVPVKQYREVKGHLFLKTEATALAIVQKGLQKFITDPPDTVSELKDLMGMISQLDKITRLEDGKPTEIIKSTNYTPKRIIQIIEADPMYGGPKRKYHGKEKEENEEENNPRRIEGRDADEGGHGKDVRPDSSSDGAGGDAAGERG